MFCFIYVFMDYRNVDKFEDPYWFLNFVFPLLISFKIPLKRTDDHVTLLCAILEGIITKE